MKLENLDYEKIGRSLVNMLVAADMANHAWVKSSADHDVLPGDENPEGQFVVDMFTKKVEEIKQKWT